jgi:SAM-dependent methyltransferase/DNA-binding transcriptional ArsR family regulator
MQATVDTLNGLVEGVRAAGEPTRLRILALLARAELTVSELTSILKQSQPRVSRHLKLLTDAGLIDRSREGAWVFYRAGERPEMAVLRDTLVRLLPETDATLFRDLERLEGVRAHRAAQAQRYFAANAAEWNRLRALHVAEADVERAIQTLLAGRSFEAHLDVGTGTGRILELLSAQSGRSLGVDLSAEMLAIARARIAEAGLRRAQVRLADLFELPAEDASFDLVTLHQVLHYLDDPGRAVAEAARVLKPTGTLLIADFAPHEIETLRTEHQHRRLGFDRREVDGWFEAAGLKLVDSTDLPPDRAQGLTVSLWVGGQAQPVPARAGERART